MKKRTTSDILLDDLMLRADHPLTQEEIAEYIGVSQEEVSRLERAFWSGLEAALRDADLCYNDVSDILNHLGEADGRLHSEC